MVVETKCGIPRGLNDDNNANFQMLSSQNKCRKEWGSEDILQDSPNA